MTLSFEAAAASAVAGSPEEAAVAAPIDSNDDYLSLMNKNLDNLVAGMGC